MPSILDGVNPVIDQKLKLGGNCKRTPPHYEHDRDYQIVSRAHPSDFDGHELVKAIYDEIDSNWNKRRYTKNPSLENWRLKKNPAKKDESKKDNREKKLEVRLERAIVDISPKDWSDADNWVNQVPTASGFVGPRSDKRRALDLVHRLGDGVYELVELKVDVRSGTPLYAAMEILQHGVLYIYARKNERIKGAAKEKRLLEATTIHLRVLAPCDYYEGCKLDWLENEIRKGLASFLDEREPDLKMDFQLQAFPPTFSLKRFPQPDAIIVALSDRRPVYSS